MTGELRSCAASFAFDACNVSYRVMAADWPPDEDATRLADVVAEVKAEAAEKAARETTRRESAAV